MLNKILNSLREILNENGYTNLVVSRTLNQVNWNEHEKKLYTKIVYGVVENKILLDYYLQPLTKGKRIKPFVRNALRIGVYGMDNLNLPKYYLVNEVVDCIKKLDYKASTFVNALLRKYQQLPKRNFDHLSKIESYSIKYSLPQELTKMLYQQYQDRIVDFFLNDEEIYNTYRINPLKTTIEDVKTTLEKDNILYTLEDDMILQTKSNLIHSSLFQQGKIIAQDKSSMMVGKILNPIENDVILDACSAPGSKAMQLASMIDNKGMIIAMDIYPHKIQLIENNIAKMGATCVKTMQADAMNVHFDFLFDKILIDAPCSGLGVLRHKPDLKYQMTLEKIASIKKTQEQILENMSKYVKPNGVLVYSTCTINKEENEDMIQQFLFKHPSFQKEKEIRVFPSSKEDGFYICRLRGY